MGVRADFDPYLDIPFGSPAWRDYQEGRLSLADLARFAPQRLGLPAGLGQIIWRVRVWWWKRRNPE